MGGYGGSVSRGQLSSFLGMPTDGGMQAAAGAFGSRRGHFRFAGHGGLAGRGRGTRLPRARGHDYRPRPPRASREPSLVRAAPRPVARWLPARSSRDPEEMSTHTAQRPNRGVAAGPEGVAAGSRVIREAPFARRPATSTPTALPPAAALPPGGATPAMALTTGRQPTAAPKDWPPSDGVMEPTCSRPAGR